MSIFVQIETAYPSRREAALAYDGVRHPLTILDDRRTGRRLKIAYAGQAAGTAAA